MAPIQHDDVRGDHPPPPTPNDPHPYVPAGVLRVVRVAPTRRGGRGRDARGRGRGARGSARGVRGRRGRGVRDRPREGEPLRRRRRRRLVNNSSSREEELTLMVWKSDNSESVESGSASDVYDKCGSTDHITPDCFRFLKKNTMYCTPVHSMFVLARSDGVWWDWDADIILVHRSVLGGYNVRYHDDEGCIESNVPANRIRRRRD